MLPLAAVLCSSALAFHLAPATTPAVRSTLHRGASNRMLIETGVLDAIMPGYQAPVLPPEFAELAQPPQAEHHARFSDTLMNAVGVYIIISGGSTFWPRIKAKFTGEDPVVSEEAINKYLNSLPISSFGWHQADLSTPLPVHVSELTAPHPIGVHQGRKAFLCSRESALTFADVEVSEVFTKHYGEEVFIGLQ